MLLLLQKETIYCTDLGPRGKFYGNKQITIKENHQRRDGSSS